MIVNAIPAELYSAVAAGVGLFIALIGLRNAGIIVAERATMVALGNLHSSGDAARAFGLLVTAASALRAGECRDPDRRAGDLGPGALTGTIHWQPAALQRQRHYFNRAATEYSRRAGARACSKSSSFFCLSIFSTTSARCSRWARKPGYLKRAAGVPRINRILYSDAIATVTGSLAGTSTVVSYIESTAGVAVGGRSGVTAIVTGLLFGIALFVAPLAGAIPSSATAPALIVVGSMMMTAVAEIAWTDPEISIPAFLTMTAIPLTYSIANGLAFGFCSWTLIKILRGRFRQVSWMVYALTALFLLRFYWI